MRIATGEETEDVQPDDGKSAAAKELGSKGGKKRAANMSPERRAEIAKKAAESRWNKRWGFKALSPRPSLVCSQWAASACRPFLGSLRSASS